jgi:ATP-binding cassette subfamily B (MDR/TAP) protein 7
MLNGRLLFSTSTSKTENSSNNKNDETKITKFGPSQDQIADMKILRTLASYIWMKDNPEFRLRVVTALAFLVGAKVSYISNY